MKFISIFSVLVVLVLISSPLWCNALLPPKHFSSLFPGGRDSLAAMSETSLKTYVSSQTQTASSRYHVAVTPEMNFNTDPAQIRGIGAGVTTLTNKPDLVSGVFETSSLERVISDYPVMTERVTKIETEEDKMNSMSSAAQVSGSGYGLTVTASASLAKKTETKKTRVTYTMDFLVTHKEANLNTTHLRLSADPLHTLNTDTSSFFKKYGGYFYSSYRTGCYLSANLQVETDSETTMQELSAELDVAYKAGMFNAHANARFKDAISSFSDTVTISGDFEVVGVKVSETSIKSPADVIALKDEVVEKCAALEDKGSAQVVSATFSSYLSAPYVVEQITNKEALLDMAAGVITDEQMNAYWDLRNEYAILEETTQRCAADPNLCFIQDFFYDNNNLKETARALYKNVSTDSAQVKELSSTFIAQNPEILQQYEENLFSYANEYTSMFQTYSQLDVEGVQMFVVERESGNITAKTSIMEGDVIHTADAPKSINQTFHELNGEVMAISNVNYIIDKGSKKPYLVVSARCLNGGLALACYDLEDIAYATQHNEGILVLDEKKTNPAKLDGQSVPPCSYSMNGNHYDFTVQIAVKNPFPNADASVGSRYGQQCPEPDETLTFLADSVWAGALPAFDSEHVISMDALHKKTWCDSNIFSDLYQKELYVSSNFNQQLDIATITGGSEACPEDGGIACRNINSYKMCLIKTTKVAFPPNWQT